MTDKKDKPQRHSTKKIGNEPRATTTGGPGPRNVDQSGWRVKLRTERIKFTDDAKQIFLEEFAKHNLITVAAKAAGVSYHCVKAHLDNDEEFMESMQACKIDYRDRVIGHAQRLMLDGIEEPIIGGQFKDEHVGVKITYPTNLIAMEMRKVDPDYKERSEIDLKNGGGGGVLVVPAGMTAEAWIKEQEEKNKAKDKKPGAEVGKPAGSK